LSSILKALKRIEGQPPPAAAFPALPESVDAKQAVNSAARKRWLLRRIMTIAVVLLIIAGGAVIGFQHRNYLISKIFPDAPPPVTQEMGAAEGGKSKIFRAKIPPEGIRKSRKTSSPMPTSQPPAKTAASEKKSKKIKAIEPPEKSRSSVARPASRPKTVVSSRQPQRKTTVGKPESKATSSKIFTPSKKSIAGKRTASRKPSAVERKKPQARTYARLTDSKLKLQALAWSSDASRRMAVINGRIVREGESTDGYQINQIRKEDVVVSDGRQSWSLEFGLQQ
jgi:hypothetical protein